MTEETRKLFDAPWKAVDMVDTNFPYLHECEIVSNNGNGHMIATEVLRTDANRLANLPELYDALMYFVVNDCPHAFISNDECRLCPDKKCKTREAVELLRKVRDGE